MNKHLAALLVYILLSASLNISAQIQLPRLVTDSMVLQRDAEVKIWGWASPKEKINIRFQNKIHKTITGADGKWLVKLSPMKAGGPYSMDIIGSNKITLKDILIGDVWFCSGQSNMVHQLNIHDVTYAGEIANANYPQIRQFWIPALTNLTGPKDDLPAGNWKAAVGEDIRPFSAVAFFFAKKLYERYNIPIGIINASVGGTPIEAWTSETGLKEFPALQATIEKNKDTAYINGLSRRLPLTGNRPTAPVDAGLAGAVKWFDVSYTPKGWRTINIPGYWEDQGVKDLNGVVWYRKEIDIPASMVGKPAKVFLGRIVDADELYINGKKVGTTTYQYPQRRYPVAADVLKAGKNIFVIRVTNTNGKGGFVTDKPYCIFSGNDTVDLKGYWQYKVGEVFTAGAGGNTSGPRRIVPQNEPTALYNGMIAPFIKYPVKGVLWYQGESNAGHPEGYTGLMKALIKGWREVYRNPDLPFIYAQLPNFMDVTYSPSESSWALLRESQLKVMNEVSNTAMTVNIDLGEWNDIHPDNKKNVGERMALAARKLVYKEDIVYSGPIYQDHRIDGNKIIISFSQIGSGLITKDGDEPGEFAIAGEDKKFVWAKAKIDGNKVTVWSEAVTDPKYARYAWADNPDNPNLYNKEGLPASPFRIEK